MVGNRAKFPPNSQGYDFPFSSFFQALVASGRRANPFPTGRGAGVASECYALDEARLLDIVPSSLAWTNDLFPSKSPIPDGEVHVFVSKRAEWRERFQKTLKDLFDRRKGLSRTVTSRRARFIEGLVRNRLHFPFPQQSAGRARCPLTERPHR